MQARQEAGGRAGYGPQDGPRGASRGGLPARETPPLRGRRGRRGWIFATFLYHNRARGKAPSFPLILEFPLKLIINLSILILFPLLSRAEIDSAGGLPAEEQAAPVYGLYRDVSREQSDLAHEALNHAYSADLKSARRTLAAMRKLEAEKRLPPLSELLSVAIDVMRYQNGDYGSAAEEKALLKSIEQAAGQGRWLGEEALRKQENHPTYLLILGGIRGFLATLKIQPDPSEAMGDGFQALKLLEKSRERDGRVKDSYMGTGIFHCTVANAPLFVRATLKIIGRSVNMRAGLEALRISAYEGQYTSVASQLFLIQFLTPYEEELKREKRQIFASLERTYPGNPYYTFLKTHEALCFYPDSFFRPETRPELERRIAAFKPLDYAGRRYANLVKHQYRMLHPGADRRFAPDSGFDFRDYRFYPVFLQAVRFKRNAEDSLAGEGKPPSEIARVLKGLREQCLDLIEESPMSATRKRYYRWHVTDALRWKARQDRDSEKEPESVTESRLDPGPDRGGEGEESGKPPARGRRPR